MVKAVLEYNPYIRDTKVEFNGNAPRINSLVEKYRYKKIQEWITEIPQIFHDEMNGYDFELEFSGTKMDFTQLEKAFERAGVTSKQVKLFHKKEYDSRDQTVLKLHNLLEWLEKEQIKELFDIDKFKEENKDILNEDYGLITVNGKNLVTSLGYTDKVSVEDINTVDALEDVSLSNVPIIINVTAEVIPDLQKIIKTLNDREDVYGNQKFFIISEDLEEAVIQRTIEDLGIAQLQLVDSLSADTIKQYLYAYPVTDYIWHVLGALRLESDYIYNIIEDKVSVSKEANRETYEQIEDLDNALALLRDAQDRLKSRDNPELPVKCTDARERLSEKIKAWKKNKVYSSEEYAEKNAKDFSAELKKYLADFVCSVNEAINEEEKQKIEEYTEVYKNSGGDDFEVEEGRIEKAEYEIPDMVKELLRIRKSEMKTPVTERNLKDLLFGDKKEETKEPVLVTLYYYAEWREYALDVFTAIADEVIRKQYEALKDRLKVVAEGYVGVLEESIKANTLSREEIASKLSRDEKKLQDEVKWITIFRERIERIERG